MYSDDGRKFKSNIQSDDNVEFYGDMISSSKLYDTEAMKLLIDMVDEKINNLDEIKNQILLIKDEMRSNFVITDNENLKNEVKISRVEASSLSSLISIKENVLSSCIKWVEKYVRSIQTPTQSMK
jgi:hypothetical protein